MASRRKSSKPSVLFITCGVIIAACISTIIFVCYCAQKNDSSDDTGFDSQEHEADEAGSVNSPSYMSDGNSDDSPELNLLRERARNSNNSGIPGNNGDLDGLKTERKRVCNTNENDEDEDDVHNPEDIPDESQSNTQSKDFETAITTKSSVSVDQTQLFFALLQNEEATLESFKTFITDNPEVLKLPFPSGLRLIHIVISHEKFEWFKYLIEECKVNVNVKSSDPEAFSPLHFATRIYSDEEACKYVDALIKAGAKVYTTDAYSRTPLFDSVVSWKYKTAERLLQAGANPNTPVVLESKDEDTVSIQYIITYSVIEDAEFDDVEDLNFKATSLTSDEKKYCKDVRMLGLLLKYGADPSCVDTTGRNGLHYAIQYNNLDAIKLILKKFPQLLSEPCKECKYSKAAANSTAITFRGLTPIELAQYTERKPIIRYLEKLDKSATDSKLLDSVG